MDGSYTVVEQTGKPDSETMEVLHYVENLVKGAEEILNDSRGWMVKIPESDVVKLVQDTGTKLRKTFIGILVERDGEKIFKPFFHTKWRERFAVISEIIRILEPNGDGNK